MASIDTHLSEQYKLVGSSNYVKWKFKVQTILEWEDLWEFVNSADESSSSSNTAEPPDPRDPSLVGKLKKYVLSIIRLSVQENVVPFIVNISCPREGWGYMQKKFDIKNNARKLAIRANFTKLRMEEGSSVIEFLTEVQILINSLNDIGELPCDTMVVEEVLNVLPPSFDSIVTNISGSH